jgi:hypothetical protein
VRSAVLLLLALVACGPDLELEEHTVDDSAVSRVNHDDRFLVVVDVNWENLPTPSERPCAGEYRDLIYWMKDRALSPDFVIVQQVSGRDQADRLASIMSDLLVGGWRAIVAEANPAPQGSPCGAAKAHQTNAILYRPRHFDPVGPKDVFQTFIGDRSGGVKLNDQARTKTVVQRFRDKRSDRIVTVASTHWATAKSGGTPKSALASMKRVHAKLRDAGGDLRIWGGDTNTTDLTNPGSASSSFRDWYQAANGEVAARAIDGTKYNYRDAAYADCSGSKACLIQNHRTTSRRIDFLMATKPGALPRIDRVHTVGFAEAGRTRSGDDPNLPYSDHRAVAARIWY